ncbi:EAL domain-containing protein (putative c-di-GMP-specific phosphodiesterase class I) [Glaciihabitans tibetensis]|uniref:EAL domain-containing protein (Putative c-di-GMP-specific phosphodiesterase class I) n=1 Tax=Glaciihabitans tibetensis TaxID=1266600 RepID=A0A2T0VCW3_9MICO|nr:EAL domain-containing protein [Glaciihabitans tibetensis]PRY68026.1 EAL domain-containing protein (putative c-di-GMP-specific phosphodiesterase class I) [Glaciihabitans tibetensis]
MNYPYPSDPAAPRSLGDLSRLHANLAADLDGAAERGELVAYFQPQIDLATGRVVAAEALCRWWHPRLGMVSPGVFIAIAEQSDVIHEVGAFMLEESCSFLEETSKNGHSLEVAINVSPAQLTSTGVLDYLAPRIESGALDPQKITLEVTETIEIVDLGLAAAQLNAMRAIGLGVSLDDYGAGHSSATQLGALPVTEVKIDRSLVQGDSEDSRTQVAEVIDLARERGLRVVAEGVENSEQNEYVVGAGCERAQGFLLGRPMNLSKFDRYLTGWLAEA